MYQVYTADVYMEAVHLWIVSDSYQLKALTDGNTLVGKMNHREVV
jgi:hypothetical protein